jgi:hypothetical protein
MIREQSSLLSDIFGKTPKEGLKTSVVLNAYSQPHVLQQRMREQKLTHGETVTANISPVRLEANFGKMTMYFCPVESLEILQRVEAGDGGALPAEAKLEGIEVPSNFKPGLYDLKNVTLYSNGSMQVIVTDKTEFVLV